MNKTELFELIADCVVEQCTEPAVIATNCEKVVTYRGICNTGLQPCNHKEADTRVLFHIQDAVQSGFKKVMIIANDTDFAVISSYALIWE